MLQLHVESSQTSTAASLLKFLDQVWVVVFVAKNVSDYMANTCSLATRSHVCVHEMLFHMEKVKLNIPFNTWMEYFSFVPPRRNTLLCTVFIACLLSLHKKSFDILEIGQDCKMEKKTFSLFPNALVQLFTGEITSSCLLIAAFFIQRPWNTDSWRACGVESF